MEIKFQQHLKPQVSPKNNENPARGVEVREKVKSGQKIQNFEKFLNLSSDLDRATFSTPSFTKKTKKIQPEVWKLGKRSKVGIKI